MAERRFSRSDVLTAGAFALLLPLFLLRAYPRAATLDSLACAISVAEWRPGFLDGKPTYAFLGQIVRVWNDLAGGTRADLMRRLSLWCALFAWGIVVNVYLLGRDLRGGRRSRGWAAAALLVSSPIFLFMAAIVEKYTVCLYLLTLAAILWLRRRYASWGIVWGIALGAHITSLLLAVPCAISLLRDPGRAGDRARALRGCALAAAVAAPLYLWVLSYSRGAGSYLEYVRSTVFGDYGFMASLRPDRIISASLARPLEAMLLAALVALALVVVLAARRRSIHGGAATGSAAGEAGGSIGRLVVIPVAAMAALLVFWTHRGNLPQLLERGGYPLAAIALVAAAVSLRQWRRGSARSALGESPDLSHFVLPWFATNLLFFTAWDHFYGQFSLFIVVPLVLLIAGLGTKGSEGRAFAQIEARAAEDLPSLRDALAFSLIGLAVASGLWLSHGVVEKTRWRMTGENDAMAVEQASVIPPGSLVVAAWDSANLSFHAPSIEVVTSIAGRQSGPVVWKGRPAQEDPIAKAREALRSGRRAFVTARWLDQKGDPAFAAERAALESEFALEPAARGLSEIVPRREGR